MGSAIRGTMTRSYAPIMIQSLFVGMAAGNLWSVPFIGGSSWIGLLVVAVCMYFPARLHEVNRFGRTALVAALAWPLAYAWQALHQSAPGTMLSWLQISALLVGSQIGALLSGWRVKPRDVGQEPSPPHS